MLHLLRPGRRPSESITRRTLLRVGTLGLAGLSLPELFQVRPSQASTPPRSEISVILLFLSGGPSQLDMWDPKPDAPDNIRGPFQTIATRAPGIRFTELLPGQARVADKLAVIRSVHHTHNTHDASQWLLSGYHYSRVYDQSGFAYPSMGSVCSKVMDGRWQLPYFHLGPQGRFSDTRAPEGYGAGYLGSRHEPVVIEGDPNSPRFTPPLLERFPTLTAGRFDDRRKLLERINSAAGTLEQTQTARNMDESFEKAYTLLTSTKARQAFDLSREPVMLRDRYGRNTFGQCCLMARRLVESGVRFVTVAWPNFSAWDTHQNNFSSHKQNLVPPLDTALAALIEDCHGRGILDTTLILCMGELGRTPKINGAAGRDHWSNCFSVVVAGGGVPGGQTIGASDHRSTAPGSRPIKPEDLCATVYHKLGVDFTEALHDRQGRPYHILPKCELIRELLG